MRQISIIKMTLTREQLEAILGKPSWDWDSVEDNKPECGLAAGVLLTAGWGDLLACCRIWIHSDGMCVAPGMNIQQDIKYAQKIYRKLLMAGKSMEKTQNKRRYNEHTRKT